MSQFQQLGRTVRHTSWVPKLARAGYASKGVLYGVIGVLAAAAAFGGGGEGATTGSKGALETLRSQPFGKMLLVVMIVGLIGYSVWRFVQATVDPENEGSDAKGIAKRVGCFFIGLLHLSLVVYAIGLLTGAASGAGEGAGGGAPGWTARLMSWPGGPWIVGAAGLVVVGLSGYQLYRAWNADLDDQLDLSSMSARAREWTVGVSRFGMAARGIVGVIVGIALVFAGVRTNPNEAKGLGAALASIQGWTLGGLMLGIVGAGLVAYGVYELVEARYRRIRTT